MRKASPWILLWLAALALTILHGSLRPTAATVLSSAARNDYTGNGVTVVYPYAFRVLDATHLKVTVNAVLKSLSTDYTVSGVGASAGGNVTFTVAPPNGQAIIFSRNVPITQVTDYVQNAPLQAETLERNLDKLTMIAQQLNTLILDQALVPSSSFTGSGSAGQVAYWTAANGLAGSANFTRTAGTPDFLTLLGRLKVQTGGGFTSAPGPIAIGSYYFTGNTVGPFNGVYSHVYDSTTDIGEINTNPANDKIAVNGWCIRRSGGASGCEGGFFGVLIEVGSASGAWATEVTTINDFQDYPSKGFDASIVNLAVTRSGLFNTNMGIYIASTDARRYYHAIHFASNSVCTSQVDCHHIFMNAAGPYNFLTMHPSDDVDGTAMSLLKANGTTVQFLLLKRGSIQGRADSTAASAPTFSWVDDPDTGMYRASANNIGFAAGGTVQMQVNSGGINVTAYTGGGTVMACINASGSIFRGTATTCP